MRLITKRKEVLRRLHSAAQTAFPLFCPNAETPCEMEGIMLAAQRFAEKRHLKRFAMGIGFTATYPDHPQLGQLALTSAVDSIRLEETALTWLGWLKGYADRDGLFDAVEIVPFLDHGWARHEADIQLMNYRWFQDALGIIMFDASSFEFEENIRLTAEYVRKAGSRVVVEGCPDKVYERGTLREKGLTESDLISRPSAVRKFVNETGVDIVVPNLGTEHRSVSAEPIKYRRKVARAITRAVGPIQALHGTSSLGNRLAGVGSDGICKINYYTAMARHATAALTRQWAGSKSGDFLPIAHACGSFIHRTRRDAIADHVEAMLLLLSKSDRSQLAD